MFDFRFIFAVLAVLVGFLTWQGVDLFGLGGVKAATEKPIDAMAWVRPEMPRIIVLGSKGRP